MYNCNNNGYGNGGCGGSNNRCQSHSSVKDGDFLDLQNARKDLVGEINAIIEYDDHVHTATDELAKATWENIRDEEMTHVGELLGLINYLAPYQKQFVVKGWNEFKERAKDMGQ